jgi:acetolactate synthase small subunit
MSGARLLDDRPESLTLELTASGPSLDRFMEQVGRHGEIVTVVRSGTLAITRGAGSLELNPA